MSGITGYTSLNAIKPQVLEQMINAIKHRGRDAESQFYTEKIGLGFCEHEVRNTGYSLNNQNLYLERYVVVADARLYNYIELISELEEAGYALKTTSENEIIALAYDHWGVECLNKFNGPLALFLFDTHKKEYFLARDRFGKKPFYFYRSSETFVFGSEVKAIYASGLVPILQNTEYLENYIKEGPKEYLNETAFKNIQRFPVASYFKGTLDQLLSEMSIQKYWTLSINKSKEVFQMDKAKIYAEQYYQLLKEAVQIRMRTDCEIGAALSGGLDSSSIVYLMQKEIESNGCGQKLETFSTVYKTPGTENCDESTHINMMIKALGVNSNQIEPAVSDIPEEHKKVINALENPPESTCMSGWHTFKLVKEKNIKVTLDGQGADEQLAGYLSYIPSYLLSLSYKDFFKELPKFLRIPGSKKQVLYAFLLTHYSILFGKGLTNKTIQILLKREMPMHLGEELQKSMGTGLVTLLHYADHTTAAHSVESRMPFMDYRLVEFLASIPATYKMHKGWTKYIARLAFDGKLPNEICWRQDKMGWPIPEEYWFNGELKEWFNQSTKTHEDINGIKNKIRILNINTLFRVFFREKE